jgi:hypothetical protein
LNLLGSCHCFSVVTCSRARKAITSLAPC